MLTREQAEKKLQALNALHALNNREVTEQFMQQLLHGLSSNGWKVALNDHAYVFVEVPLAERVLLLAAQMEKVEISYDYSERDCHELELFEVLVTLLAPAAQVEAEVSAFLRAYYGNES